MGKRNPRPRGGLVYSTGAGRTCPTCRRPISECPGHRDSQPASDGVIRIRRETKGRKGRVITLVTGVPLEPSALAKLATELKKKCGSGGTVREGVVEIQGDHREVLTRELAAKGWRVKLSGG